MVEVQANVFLDDLRFYNRSLTSDEISYLSGQNSEIALSNNSPICSGEQASIVLSSTVPGAQYYLRFANDNSNISEHNYWRWNEQNNSVTFTIRGYHN